ncbi:IclR family transcriptional regulator [Nocardiopsis ansamitocini]|uniref:IclR family transcriptional regulator n=1 Tax=Nocardiopsis ansamitocini TaxID=1670832 RepID=A0A9W6PB22_9ACTN|nr:IclR family transcriptional regulator [Nocardiopsis ansamitocini]GLU50277.1 IclR family transcriptional regulator [Nocardiopsis ansamitocini]
MEPDDPPPAPPPGTQTLARGLSIITAVAQGADTLKSISTETGIGRSTAHRLVQMLIVAGFLRKGVDNSYVLGPSLIEYGFLALQQNPVPFVARPVLEQLSQKLKDTVHLAIRENDEVFYLDKIPSLRGAEMRSRIGYRMPLTRTGIGKALLLGEEHASWERCFQSDHERYGPGPADAERFLTVMKRYTAMGATMDLEENEPGIRCVAAPVRDGSKSVVAAVSIAATRPYMPMERMRALVPVMREAALDISTRLGYSAVTAGANRPRR